jgi:hypothetical protein
MTGSILQLVATGIEDIFLTNDPQITYYKIVYKRHTNFAREEINQYFLTQPDFGTQVSINIAKQGDLMEKTILVINLPAIEACDDKNVKYAWCRYIGYTIIDNIEIEINGRQICRHYGEWMMLWNQMFNDQANYSGFRKMIGDIPELTTFTSCKSSYRLFIPLQFWFCRSSSMALPLVSLIYSDIKINLSLRPWNECLITLPTHYIICQDDLAAFIKYEYIYQTIDGITSIGIYSGYDSINNKLLYTLLTPNNFTQIPQNNSSINQNKYKITGKTSNAYVLPIVQNQNTLLINPATYKYDKLKSLTLGDVHLIINYIFLDEDERLKFSQKKHDYIIEQLYYNYANNIPGSNDTIRLNIDNPCKYIIWMLQQQYLYDSNYYYNYTAKYDNNLPYDIKNNDAYNLYYNNENDSNNLILKETIFLNEQERLTYRESKYFRINQIYEKCTNPPPSGVNAYFFTLDPITTQPNGSCNMSKFEKIEIKMNINSIITPNNLAFFRSYAETSNILRVSNGLAAIMFDR